MKRVPGSLEQARAQWRYRGQARPDFAAVPGPGQESVWDYPRPPRIEPVAKEVRVSLGNEVVARTRGAMRVLETASPPTFYLPRADVRVELFEAGAARSGCEWKGKACYWTLAAHGQRLENVAWSYEEPFPGFEQIAGFWSFYPARLDCRIDGVRVAPQPGNVYGGWVTPDLAGPFKGEPGTGGW